MSSSSATVTLARDDVQRGAAEIEALLGGVPARSPRRDLEAELAAGQVHAVEPCEQPLGDAHDERARCRELERLDVIVGAN
jgi:hypothetical protein